MGLSDYEKRTIERQREEEWDEAVATPLTIVMDLHFGSLLYQTFHHLLPTKPYSKRRTTLDTEL